MKKIFVLFFVQILLINIVSAGGIMTNTNQSSSYIRMPARNASLGIDAAYYNPAGLVQLSDGFHLSLNNQSVFQTRTIDNSFALLNDGNYQGEVNAPLFPSIYAVYKTGKLAVSGGIVPVGGGGSAEYHRGLPSFETTFASIPALLSAQGITTTDYDVDIFFDGSSVFFGGQLGLSYQISEIVSLYGGLRYVTATNTYEGHLKNLLINPSHPLNSAGGMINAHDFFNNVATMAYGAASNVQPIIDNDMGDITLDDAVGFGLISQEQAGQLAGGLGDAYNEFLTISQIQGAYQSAAQTAGNTADELADRKVDARQTGTAIAPMMGVNLTLSENFNIGIKYEFLTKLELENDTEIDETGMFPDGAKTRSDMPALLSVGAAYKATEKLNIAGGIHYYFDKSADYGKTLNGEPVNNEEVIDNNFIELALGFEYELTSHLLVSAGYLRTQTGVNENYQSDLSHSLSTNSAGLGGRYAINEMIAINLGFMRTFYEEDSKPQNLDPLNVSVTETYNRKAMVIAVGLDFTF